MGDDALQQKLCTAQINYTRLPPPVFINENNALLAFPGMPIVRAFDP
jgi:hypothetical protein